MLDPSLIRETSMPQLDRIDHAIITVLQEDARVTLIELASRVGLSKTPCQLRMRRLETEGYILGYSARINLAKLGARHIAFVQVTLSDTKTKSLMAFNSKVRLINEVEQCHMIAGGFD